MSFCPSCGINVGESAFCPDCGYPVNGKPPAVPPSVQYAVKPVTPDAPDKGWFIIGFILPPVGLIMYLLFHGTQPKRAASAGKGALWMVITALIVAVILLIVMIILSFTTVSYAVYSTPIYSAAPLIGSVFTPCI